MKDAIADTFKNKFGKRPNVNPVMPDISINLHIAKHTCTVSLDSSGGSLHKRGYKSNMVTAPLNEVLAAGLILLSNWDKSSDLHDPMCGSGTLLIEAALIAYNIPANIFREKFGFEGWKDFDKGLWETIKDVSLMEIPFEINALSAHRVPQLVEEFATNARKDGIKVIIAGAGGAAHLPGMIASNTPLPVIGVPIKTDSLNGMDSLLSIVQMPNGVPVATVAIGAAKNAALLAIEILATNNQELTEKLIAYKKEIADESRKKDELINKD